MSDYQGNIVIKNPATPTGPSAFGRAPGMWKLSDVAYWIKQGVWPNPAIVPDIYFPYVSLLLSSTSLGNANNNLFVDSSGVFNPMARVGNTTQGSITPYGSNWSNYFDGNGDYLTAPDNAVIQFGTGNFTVEGWFNLSSFTTAPIFDQRASGPSTNAFIIAVTSAGKMIYYSYSPLRDVTFNTTLSINTWYHFAFVRSGNTGTMYINGVAEATTVDMSGYNNTSSANRIMQAFDPSYATGYLSNFRIVKGTAVYTANFTPPTAPLTAISGTGLLTCQSNRFIDNSGNNLTITAYGDTRVTDFSPFSPAYPGMTGYNQSDITNWSGWFNGGTDRVQVPVTSNMYLGTTYTIEAWAYYNSTSYGARPIFSETEAFQGGFAGLNLTLNTSGQLVAEYRPATSGPVTTITGPTVTPYTWFHIALVSDNSSAKLYVNGTQVGSTTTFGDYPSAKTAFVAVGSWGHGWNDVGIPAAAWIGYISNMRVVKGVAVYTSNFTPSTTPLTAISGTVLLTCQNAAFTDNSSVNNILTPVSNATVNGNSPFNTTGFWSNYFTGSAYLSLPVTSSAFTLPGNFTLEAWVYRQPSGYVTLFDTRSGGNYTDWVVGVGSSGEVDFVTVGGPGVRITTSERVAANTWTHVACVREGSAVKIYINGVASVNTAIYSATISPASTEGWIGRTKDPLNNSGYISNLRLVKGTAVYTANFTPPTAPLTAISGTSLLTCQNGRFIDNSANAFTLTPNNAPQVQSFDPFYTSTVASNGGSVYFDGSSYLATQNIPANAIGSANCTIESWVQFTSPGANSDTPFFGNYTGTWTTNSIYWGKHTAYTGRVAFWVNNYSAGTALLVDTSLPTGSWHHYAVTRSGSTWRMFRDGVVVATATWSGDATGSNGLITPGRADVLQFSGYLSDMRVVNGTAMYTSAFTPPTAPLTPTPATVFLLNGMNAGAYDATAINDMTTVGNAQVRYPSPFAPANYWAGAFPGNGGNYLAGPNNAAFAMGTGDFTIEFWAYFTNASDDNGPIFDTRTSANNGVLIRQGNGAGGIANRVDCNCAGTTASSGTISFNTWTHVAVVRSSSSLRIYLDGVGGTAVTASGNASASNSYIGAFFDGLSVNFDGYLSNLRVVKGTAVYTSNFTPSTTPLTAISGTSLLTCQNKTFIDNSSNAFTITAFGNATAGAIGPFTATGGTSMYFDGTTSNRIKPPASPIFAFGTGNFTVEAWVYVTNMTTENFVFDTRSSASTAGMGFSLEPNTGKLRYSGNANNVLTSTAVTANTWTHVAWVRNGSTLTGYINGVSGGTASNSDNLTQTNGEVGNVPFSAVGTNMYIDDLRVTRGIARYTSNFTPPTQAFPVY